MSNLSFLTFLALTIAVVSAIQLHERPVLHSIVSQNLNARAAADQIEYRINTEQIALLLPININEQYHRRKLYTFEPDTTVAEFYQSKMLKRCHSKRECKFNVNGIELLSSIVQFPDVQLVCTEKTYRFTEFINDLPTKQQLRAHFRPNGTLKMSDEKRKYPYFAAEILGNTLTADWQWVKNFAEWHWGTLHAFQTWEQYNQTGVFDMTTGQQLSHEQIAAHVGKRHVPQNTTKVSICADWGAGTMESDYVQSQMMQHNPDWTLHLGDVYYVGTPDEVKTNCLGIAPKNAEQGVKWPLGNKGGFALPGNHEFYSRGIGYYDYFLPAVGVVNNGQPSGQKASYMVLQDNNWRIVGLDTGYNTYKALGLDNKDNKLRDEIVDWLRKVVRINDPADTRGIVFVSHHQAISAFDEPYLSTPTQIAQLLAETGVYNRTFLWLFGHEHRLAFYDEQTVTIGANNITLYSRCIGNSGFPTSLGPIPERARASKLVAYDDRLYTIEDGNMKIKVGFNGYSVLTFSENTLTMEHSSLSVDTTHQLVSNVSTPLVHEVFTLDEAGSLKLTQFNILEKDITVVNSE